MAPSRIIDDCIVIDTTFTRDEVETFVKFAYGLQVGASQFGWYSVMILIPYRVCDFDLFVPADATAENFFKLLDLAQFFASDQLLASLENSVTILCDVNFSVELLENFHRLNDKMRDNLKRKITRELSCTSSKVGTEACMNFGLVQGESTHFGFL